jgi:hypothetical protein
VVVALADVEQRLGTIRGRQWIKHRGIEYSLERHAISDEGADRLLDGQFYVADSLETGELVYHRAKAHPAGSYSAGGRPASPVKMRRSRPPRRVDALSAIPLFAARPESWSSAVMRPERDPVPLSSDSAFALQDPAASTPSLVRMFDDRPNVVTSRAAAEPEARGATAILDRLRRAGVTVHLTPDSQHVEFHAERGACPPELLPALDRVAPLLVAQLNGLPLRCAYCPEPAATVLAGGAPCCATHADEDLRP